MIIQTVTLSFKNDILHGYQNLATDELYMALYYATANLTGNTPVYTTDQEVVASNYAAGGNKCQNVSIKLDPQNNTAYISFDNVQWTNVSFTCRGALIYNKTQGTKSIAILNFGSDKQAGPNFIVTLPSDTSSSALIRV